MYNGQYFWVHVHLICFVIITFKSITNIFLLFTRLILSLCTFTEKEQMALDFCLFLMCLGLQHHRTAGKSLVFLWILVCGYLTHLWLTDKNLGNTW